MGPESIPMPQLLHSLGLASFFAAADFQTTETLHISSPYLPLTD